LAVEHPRKDSGVKAMKKKHFSEKTDLRKSDHLIGDNHDTDLITGLKRKFEPDPERPKSQK